MAPIWLCQNSFCGVIWRIMCTWIDHKLWKSSQVDMLTRIMHCRWRWPFDWHRLRYLIEYNFDANKWFQCIKLSFVIGVIFKLQIFAWLLRHLVHRESSDIPKAAVSQKSPITVNSEFFLIRLSSWFCLGWTLYEYFVQKVLTRAHVVFYLSVLLVPFTHVDENYYMWVLVQLEFT